MRPTDPGVIHGRPLLDLGTGDGQTLKALMRGRELVVGLDRSLDALRAAGHTGIKHRVCADAHRLPFTDAIFATVLAGDLFHHLDEDRLALTLTEISRVLRPEGRLVAWWYERPGRDAPDAPRYPREYPVVAAGAGAAGFTSISPLELTSAVDAGPPTVGLVARV